MYGKIQGGHVEHVPEQIAYVACLAGIAQNPCTAILKKDLWKMQPLLIPYGDRQGFRY